MPASASRRRRGRAPPISRSRAALTSTLNAPTSAHAWRPSNQAEYSQGGASVTAAREAASGDHRRLAPRARARAAPRGREPSGAYVPSRERSRALKRCSSARSDSDVAAHRLALGIGPCERSRGRAPRPRARPSRPPAPPGTPHPVAQLPLGCDQRVAQRVLGVVAPRRAGSPARAPGPRGRRGRARRPRRPGGGGHDPVDLGAAVTEQPPPGRRCLSSAGDMPCRPSSTPRRRILPVQPIGSTLAMIPCISHSRISAMIGLRCRSRRSAGSCGGRASGDGWPASCRTVRTRAPGRCTAAGPTRAGCRSG